MIRTRTLLIVFLTAFLIGLVALVPVRILWHHLGSAISLPVEPQQLQGNLWSGSAVVPLNGDDYTLDWQWSAAALGSGQLGYDVSVRSVALDLAATAGWRPNHVSLSGVTGYADLQAFNGWLEDYDVALAGQLWLSDTEVSRTGRVSVPVAYSQAQWRNGSVDFNWLDGTRRSADLPLLRLTVHTGSDGMITALVEDAVAEAPIFLAELSQDADLMYRLYTRVRDILNVELPGGGEVIMESQLNVREYLL